MLDRSLALAALRDRLEWSRVVCILGARQVGKSTLAQQLAADWQGPVHRFDLEDPRDAQRLSNPLHELGDLTGLVILDEIQLRPDLFPVLRVLADRHDEPARFLVLGSASGRLLRQTSESLAGRVSYQWLHGFDLGEVGAGEWQRLWLRGGFPRAFLADTDGQSLAWRSDFLRTFLALDLPSFGVEVPAPRMHQFWTMLAHYNGRLVNYSELARSLGSGQRTVHSYLDILEDAMVVRRLQPWFANVGKRQVRAPKVYIGDSGMLHALLQIGTRKDLAGHPQVGGSWEGFALRQVQARLAARDEECWFWSTHAGAELDLLVIRGGQRLGFEFKHSEAPRTSRSMHVALEDLQLDRLDVVHCGPTTFALHDRIRALSMDRLVRDLDPLT